MVNFSVFNELSLPMHKANAFSDFFKVLENLKKHGLTTIRMNKNFSEYPNILPNISLSQFMGQLKDTDQRSKIRIFLANGICVIQSPLINDEEENELEQITSSNCNYEFEGSKNIDGLACADIWNTISISFNSNAKWDCDSINLIRNNIPINIKHVSKITHMETHNLFFEEIESEIKLNISKESFWNSKELWFSKIIFCPEVKKQIDALDKEVFDRAISLLRDVEIGKKKMKDFNYSDESESVKKNKALSSLRYFTVSGLKIFFGFHIKSLPSGNRIHFLERRHNIYIGYVGKHLPTTLF